MTNATALVLLMTSLLLACNSSISNKETGSVLLARCIEAHGGAKFKESVIRFEVGDNLYEIAHEGERKQYALSSTFPDGLHRVTYDGGFLQYFVNDTLKEESSYNGEVVRMRFEGFLYTSSIPHNFTTNDVHVAQLEDVTIRSQQYHTLHISFTKVPNVPENQFILYIHPQKNTVDYIALQYELLRSIQFRRMINSRTVDGILFQDFIPFQPLEESVSLFELYQKYNEGQLKDSRPVVYNNIRVLSRR